MKVGDPLWPPTSTLALHVPVKLVAAKSNAAMSIIIVKLINTFFMPHTIPFPVGRAQTTQLGIAGESNKLASSPEKPRPAPWRNQVGYPWFNVQLFYSFLALRDQI